jgi:hypothetical protein
MTSYYAFLNHQNIVTEVIAGVDENETIDGLSPEEWYSNFRGQVCKKTSYTGEYRGVYAGIGYTYNEEEDIFVSFQPYLSWTRNGSHWEPPIPKPGDNYIWVEQISNWLSIEQPIIVEEEPEVTE